MVDKSLENTLSAFDKYKKTLTQTRRDDEENWGRGREEELDITDTHNYAQYVLNAAYNDPNINADQKIKLSKIYFKELKVPKF